MGAKQRRALLHWAQVVVAISLMACLLRRIEWSSLPFLFASLDWGLVLLAIGFLLLGHLARVARWQYLLENDTVTYSKLLVFYGVGLFSNSFLPTGFGGDGVRVALLSQTVSPRRAAFAVGLDRLIGLIALSALLGIGLWIRPPAALTLSASRLISGFTQQMAWLPGLLLVTLLGLLSLVAWYWLPILRETVVGALARLIQDVNWSRWTIGRLCQLLARGYVFSVFSHLCIVAANWMMLQAAHIEVTPDVSVWLVLAINASLLFPIAINGLGVREAAYVAVLSAYGVASTLSLAVALLSRLVQMLFALVGGVGWLLGVRL